MKVKQINLTEEKQINLKLPDELWFEAKVKAAQNRTTLTATLRWLLSRVGCFRPWGSRRVKSPTRYFRVVNLSQYQHYTKRNPPWIKLHASTLEDYDFARLQDASKMHLCAIWLLASRTDNKIPWDSEWVARRINATAEVDLNSLQDAGFIEFIGDDSNMLAPCKQSATPRDRDRDRGRGKERDKGKGKERGRGKDRKTSRWAFAEKSRKDSTAG